ncbi:MAG: hypothetical protein R3F39_10965 [Myxococcota bacterium]
MAASTPVAVFSQLAALDPVPDLIVQLRHPLTGGPLDAEQEVAACEAVAAGFRASHPNLQVRARAVGASGAGPGMTSVGMWRQTAAGEGIEALRDAALDGTGPAPVLEGAEQVAFAISLRFLRGEAQRTIASGEVATRFTTDGEPDPNGKIVIQGISDVRGGTVGGEHSAIITEIFGRLNVGRKGHIGRGDPRLEILVTEILRAQGGALSVQSTQVGAPSSRILRGLAKLFNRAGDETASEGVIGAALAERLPTEIAVEKMTLDSGAALFPTLPLDYHRFVVVGDRVVAGARFGALRNRADTAEVAIAGPTKAIGPRPPSFHIETVDMRPPLAVAWFGDGTPLSPTSLSTRIRLDLRKEINRIEVTVTDADGLVRSDDHTVTRGGSAG